MEEEHFHQLFEENKPMAAGLRPGDRVKATVVGISGENIFLDVGGKSEGILAAAELKDETGTLTVAEGESIEAYFLANRNGETIFTTKLGGQAVSAELAEAFQSGIPVSGKVSAEVKGGFTVIAAGQRCFCPFSQMGLRPVENAEDYLGQTMTFKIIEMGAKGRNILVSARAVLEEERQRQRERLQKELRVGMRVSGTVVSLRDFGAFVDIGGADGLIPISELAWGQTTKAEDVLERGQKVETVIKALDWDRDRIALSLRETLPNPWTEAAGRYTVGSVHKGTVARLAPFGAFVALEPGIDGLLHISRLGGGRHLNHAREVLEQGQEITVKVESVDLEQKRIALAPEDYEAPKKERPERRRERSERHEEEASGHFFRPESASMGTLGDLLAKAQKRQKK